MKITTRIVCSLVVGAFLAQGTPALADPVLSFGYTDLDGDFTARDATSGSFEAHADADTNGDVSRILGPAGVAVFAGNAGDGGFPGLAAVDLYMDVTDISDSGATGSGTIRLTDADGDYIEALIEGMWYNVGGAGNFIGLLSEVAIVDIGDDTTFDGTSGLFSMLFPEVAYNGNIQTLTFVDWFNNGDGGDAASFQDSDTLVQGAIVPEPATLALFLVGGLAIVARRRRA